MDAAAARENRRVPGDFLDRLDPELRAGDDRDLWADAVLRVAADVEALDRRIETPPRHVVLTVARVRRHRPGTHPDDHATMHLAWERDRGESGWRFAGESVRVRRRRGSFTATLCLPAGTVSLAYVEALVLWRPHLPWALPSEHETGREVYRYRRDSEGRWAFLGRTEKE